MAPSGNTLTLTTPTERQIVITRVFDAPRDLVFEAHTSCEHLKNWWGPRRYEVGDCEVDFRQGGTWRMVHRAEGEEHEFRGEYREIVRPERITWTFEWMGMPGHISVDTAGDHHVPVRLRARSRRHAAVRDGVGADRGVGAAGRVSGAAPGTLRLTAGWFREATPGGEPNVLTGLHERSCTEP